ncbi:hypothetical protein [Streptomyces sp. NBC_01190]|uniref:hypothetical protein n=1 Tax=Streptomyces sp. NBC_01190 TaxID=2903767 RepID=UPI003867F494|nr:hypothetical protein OG519_00370 [Streptomyces sp. NBC_01190]
MKAKNLVSSAVAISVAVLWGGATAAEASPVVVKPNSATVCNSTRSMCQYLTGTGLTVKSWISKLDLTNTELCDIHVTFRYNVGSGNNVWRTVTLPGCYSDTFVTTPNVGPVTFTSNTKVNVTWDEYGSTPTASVHS